MPLPPPSNALPAAMVNPCPDRSCLPRANASGRCHLAFAAVCAFLVFMALPARADGVSAGSLYNAGNAAARAGDWGPAVLYYEQSLALDPRSADTIANLAFVRRQADLPQPEAGRLLRWARNLPLRAWIALGAGGFWLIAGAWVRASVGWCPRNLARLLVVTGVGLLSAAGPALAGYHLDREAVIILAEDTPLRIAPAPSSDRTAFARAGERAVRLASRDQFTEVRLPDGRRGWAPSAQIGSVWGR